MLKRIVMTASALCLMAHGAQAATANGTLGDTSTGTLDVQLVIAKEIKITNLNALDLGTYVGVNMSDFDAFCVYQNIDNAYQVTITSANGAFQLDDAADANPIVYTVEWDDAGDGTSYNAVTYNTALTAQDTQSNTTNDDCATVPGGDNAQIRVSVTAAAVGAAPDDTYDDIMTIVVAPNF